MFKQLFSVWFEPTDISHVQKLFTSDAWKQITYSSPNMNELRMLNQNLHGHNHNVDKGTSLQATLFNSYVIYDFLYDLKKRG